MPRIHYVWVFINSCGRGEPVAPPAASDIRGVAPDDRRTSRAMLESACAKGRSCGTTRRQISSRTWTLAAVEVICDAMRVWAPCSSVVALSLLRCTACFEPDWRGERPGLLGMPSAEGLDARSPVTTSGAPVSFHPARLPFEAGRSRSARRSG